MFLYGPVEKGLKIAWYKSLGLDARSKYFVFLPSILIGTLVNLYVFSNLNVHLLKKTLREPLTWAF